MSLTTTKRWNEEFIQILETLSNLMSKKGEVFRARAYQKAQETIMNMTHTDITSVKMLESVPNIGKTILEKLEELVETGTVELIEHEKNNPIHIFSEIYGVGPKKAQELVALGITSIAHLRSRQNDVLNNIQRVGLRYYEDILKRIPRAEIDAYHSLFANIFKNHLPDQATFEIVGSYRRGAENSGDIDVIVTSEDNNANNFVSFIDFLIKEGVIVEVLSRGPSKCLVIAKLFKSDTFRRVDFLWATKEEFPFSILYFTGSKIFNTVMRHIALTKGCTMNEHGISDLSDKTRLKQVFHTEKDIFDFLGIVYKEPHERTDGRAVVIKELHINHSATTLKNKPKVGAAASVAAVNAMGLHDKTRRRSVSSYSTNELFHDYRLKGKPFLEKLSENQMATMLKDALAKYHNTATPIITDAQFDLMQDFFKAKFPANPVNTEIGAPIPQGEKKVNLPYFMGSMDKIKPDSNALLTWKARFKGPYVISCKLDGISGLFTTEGSKPQLFTRGNGTVGQDVSHLIPHLKQYLPQHEKNITIRGEFIVPKTIFDAKYKSTFANPRNMVAGIINGKSVDSKIQDVHFVCYEVITPSLKPLDQLKFIKDLGSTECVHFALCSELNENVLKETLTHWRQNNEYEIDGVIVTDDKIYERKSSGNPIHAFAFKMQMEDQMAETEVVDVIWAASKDGYLKPRVQLKPVEVCGVRIEFATGFNGAFILSNKIGPGAVVKLIRSGDVIPHITGVLKPAEEAKMPTVPFIWNATNVDIMLENASEDETVREKNIGGFFKGIEVEGLGPGNIAKLIDAGFDSVPKILNMEMDDFLTVDGFQEKTANKLYHGIQGKVREASLISIMAASNMFGRGFSKTKLESILTEVPDILTCSETKQGKYKRVVQVKGIASKTAEAFVEKIKEFCDFLVECNLEGKLSVESVNKVATDTSSVLFGKSVVLTGFRSKALEEKIKNAGGKIGSSVSKSTLAVVTKDLEGEMTGKLLDAQKHGVPIMTQEEFEDEYLS
jgi:DNA ligase (NAD+)